MKKILIVLALLLIGLEANALKSQESPYLQQHADNPVDWMPWSEAAFKKAKREHKLIFLSIGYSTCHWCHVMEHESFENKKLATFLNRHFVPIKVDREEMPHIDSYYQKVYQVMNGRGGGWPLTIIMTADKKPFFAGTYIPLEPRYGVAGLWSILKQIVEMKKKNPEKIADIAKSVERAMQKIEQAKFAPSKVDEGKLAKAFVDAVSKRFDYENGGIGRAPKFPQAPTINTLLNIYSVSGDKKALKMATLMLDHMANGGIYDQIEGGFYRYSTDVSWTIPHFEKMLYTNAELLEAYAKAYKITHKKRYKEVVGEIVTFLKKYYRNGGLYYGASDADSMTPSGKKEEGYYYIYKYDEALKALEKAKVKDAERVLEHFGISWEGNFHNGFSNPVRVKSIKVAPQEFQKAKAALQALRKKREYPFIDKKMLTAWNALLVHGLYKAGRVAEAKEIVDTIEKRLYRGGVLYHQLLPGKKAKIKAVMEDYAYYIAALLDIFEYTQNRHYLNFAKKLTQSAMQKFKKGGSWYNSQGKLKSKASIGDDAYRSALATMGKNLLRLALLSSDLHFEQEAKKLYKASKNEIAAYPPANATAVDFALAKRREYIVIKAKKELLPKIKRALLKRTTYPYIAFKESKDGTILACKSDRCFAYAKSIDAIVQKVIDEIRRSSTIKSGKSQLFAPKK